MGLGAIVLVQGLRGKAPPVRPSAMGLRAVLAVSLAIVAFALSIERLGLVLAIVLLTGDRRAGDQGAAAAGDGDCGAGADRAVLGDLHCGARADHSGLAGLVGVWISSVISRSDLASR